MRKIYEGFDNIDVAIDCVVNSLALNEFCAIKEELNSLDHMKHLKFTRKGEEFLMYQTGKDGGYAYHFKHDLGDFYVKARQDLEWPVFVSIGSEGLVKYGSLDNALEKMYEILNLFCDEIKAESVNRADYCIDFIGDFRWKLDNIAKKSIREIQENRTFSDSEKKKLIEELKELDKPEKDKPKNKGDDYSQGINAEHNNGRTTAFRMGKNPNRQLAVYDKTIEIVVKNKGYWKDIWAMSKNYKEGVPVFRIELRAFRNTLKRFMGGKRSVEKLKKEICSILCKIFNLVSYKSISRNDFKGENYSRDAKNHPFWDYMVSQFFKMKDNVLPARHIEAVRTYIDNQLAEQLKKQAIGTLVTSAYVNGVRDFDAFNDYIAEIYEHFLTMGEGLFEKKIKEISNRYLSATEPLEKIA